MTTSEMGRFTSMPLPRPRMESLLCSDMKPMTIEQEAAYTKYKIDHTEINRKQLHDWKVNWEVNCLAMKIIGDRYNANT
jgi:hypothetical protein